MEASGSWEHEDKRLKLSFPEEKQIETIEASGSGEHEDKRWSLDEEISDVLSRSLKVTFPEEEDARWYDCKKGQPHDYECQNVLMTIWSKLRKQKYSDIEARVPGDIGELIMNNFLKFAGDRIQKPSIHDFGIVAFSLSERWLAKSIHKMLKDGIDTWAPKLPVGRVMVGFPLLEDKINLGWFRQHAIAHTLIRMLSYSKVDARPSSDKPELTSSSIPQLRRKWRKSIRTKPRDRDVVICVEEKLPFILAKEDTGTIDRDLKTIWLGIHEMKADWIVYLTPVRQQEYIEMCFTAAKLEGWIKYVEGKWHPVLTYAGYRTYSTEELPNLYKQIYNRCNTVALDQQSINIITGSILQWLNFTLLPLQPRMLSCLGYDDEAVAICVLMYTCLKSHRLADCTFNSDEMVQKEGNTFVCLLHRRAEVRKITNTSRKDIDELKKASDLILDKYEGRKEGEERMLEFHLLRFNEVLKESSLFVLPHVIYWSVAETRRLLLCEATDVVMEKCFDLLGITPKVTLDTNKPLYEEAVTRGSRSCANVPTDGCAPMAVEVGAEPQKMAEREQMDGTRLEPDFVDYFITPCFVSDVRDPSRNSRFELMSIRPIITTDATFEKGFLFGLIAVSDKYGSVPDAAYPHYEPDFHYVSLFEHAWCDPVNIDMRHGGVVFPDNPRSHQVPFSSSLVIRLELYASTEKKDDCFQLCDQDLVFDFKDFWSYNINGSCGRCIFYGEDGRAEIYYIVIKDAVDAALEVSFEMETDREVHGDVFAYYGDEFHYDCGVLPEQYFKPYLYSSHPPTPGLRNSSAGDIWPNSAEEISAGCTQECLPHNSSTLCRS